MVWETGAGLQWELSFCHGFFCSRGRTPLCPPTSSCCLCSGDVSTTLPQAYCEDMHISQTPRGLQLLSQQVFSCILQTGAA